MHPVGRVGYRRRGKGGQIRSSLPRGSHLILVLAGAASLSGPAVQTGACLLLRGGTAPGLSSFCLWKQREVPVALSSLRDSTLFSAASFSISEMNVLLCHPHSCQHARLSFVTSCTPTEQKSWKKPWKTFPSKQASQIRACLSPGHRTVSRQKQAWLGVTRATHTPSERIFKSEIFLR